MSNNNSGSGGIGFLGLLSIVFIVLKLCKVIDWSWWWVTCPLWGLPAIGIVAAPFWFVIKLKQARKKIEDAGYDYDEFRKAFKESAPKSKWQQRLEEMQKAQELRKNK